MKRVAIIFLVLLSAKISFAQSESCNKAITITRRVCVGSKIIGQIAILISAINLHRSKNNTYQACSAALKISQISFSGNMAFVQSCGRASSLCRKACSGEDQNSVCEKYESLSQLATIQSLHEAVRISQSKACVDTVSDGCAPMGTCNNSFGQRLFPPILSQQASRIPGAEKSIADIKMDFDNREFDFLEAGKNTDNAKSKVNEIRDQPRPFNGSDKDSFAIDRDKVIESVTCPLKTDPWQLVMW